ncbi:MAG: insulinase family protein, partial [Aquihabitans sp.]
VIRETTAAMVADGITEREWEVARGYIEGASMLALEDSGSVMSRLGNHVCARGTVIPIEDQLAKLRAVTIEDVNRVANTLLSVEPALCGVGPITERDLGV